MYPETCCVAFLTRILCLLSCFVPADILSAQEMDLYTTGKAEAGGQMPLVPVFAFKPEFYYGGRKLEYKLPPGAESKKNALGFPAFRGSTQPPYHAAALLIIGYDEPEPVLLVDTDFDYDFSDETPLTGKEGLHAYTLRSMGRNTQSADYGFALSAFRLADTARTAELMKMVGASNITYGNTLLPHYYWYEQTNYNIMPFLVTVKGKEYKMGIMDGDNNLVFGDKNRDRIVLANDLGVFSASSGPMSRPITDSTTIVIGGQVFLLKQVEADGRRMVMEKLNTTAPVMAIGSKLPPFSIPMVDNSKQDIINIYNQKRYTLLDFWGTWCAPCMQQFPELQQLHKDFNKQLTVVGMNIGDTKERIIKYATEKKVEWQNGIATDDILRLLVVESYPTYILLDRQGKVIAFEQNISRIRQLIEKLLI